MTPDKMVGMDEWLNAEAERLNFAFTYEPRMDDPEGEALLKKVLTETYERGFNECRERVLKEAAPYCPDGVKDCTCSVSYFVDVIRALKPGEGKKP